MCDGLEISEKNSKVARKAKKYTAQTVGAVGAGIVTGAVEVVPFIPIQMINGIMQIPKCYEENEETSTPLLSVQTPTQERTTLSFDQICRSWRQNPLCWQVARNLMPDYKKEKYPGTVLE